MPKNALAGFKDISAKIKEKKIEFFMIKKDKLPQGKLDDFLVEKLTPEIHELTTQSWERFEESFIVDHVIGSDYLLLAFHEEKLVGYASTSKKKIKGKVFYYFEFLVVSPLFQEIRLGRALTRLITARVCINEILRGKFRVNMITITPSPRIVSMIRKVAAMMYPDPYAFYEEGGLPPADQETWELARSIIKKSFKPDRKIDRTGLVLHDSYDDCPNLIYDPQKVPWDRDSKINSFCDYFLDYQEKKGNEFIVIANLSLFKILRLK